jgi:protein-tyrosine phosphatase
LNHPIIHSDEGVSRSVSVAMAYVMLVENRNCPEAFRIIKSRHIEA